MWVIDMETEAIQPRPALPPKPVGVSIKHDGAPARYYAWGHPEANNCTLAEGREALLRCWESGEPLLFHNSKFDLTVAEERLGMPMPPWERVHDTLYLLFLFDPYAASLSLKPSAERILGMKPEERDEVFEWLEANGYIHSTMRKGKRVWQKDAGAYICKAPGDLVGRYAVGDVDRTWALYQHFAPMLDEGMTRAYERERRLMPVLLENERTGMRVDLGAIEWAIPRYKAALTKCDAWIRERLGKADLNIDSDPELAEQLALMGEVTEWKLTKTGRRSVSKKNLTPDMFRTPALAQALGYRNRLLTVMANSLEPWAAMASANHGYITTEWNQVRGDDTGARTGRLSCSRFMNISKKFEGRGDGYAHPAHIDVPPLPLVRDYVLPDEGGKFLHRDYSQQEFRILAHFEDGALCRAYNENPKLDMHEHVRQTILSTTGRDYGRSVCKAVNLGVGYGMGVGRLSENLQCTEEEARTILAAWRSALPDVARLDREIKRRARCGEPVRTWGGTLVYCEPPKIIDGVLRSFEYKLLNALMQRSAAEMAKEAVIRYDEARRHGRFMVMVHDEINCSAPAEHADSEMKVLHDVMSSIKADVPMLSDAKMGPSWGKVVKYDD